MKKKTFTLIMGLLLTALGAAAQNSGTTGPLTWNYNTGTKTLSITGTGAMPDYAFPEGTNRPWHAFRHEIKTVTIGNGVTTVGKFAFTGCSKLQSVTLPAVLTKIGGYAFDAAAKLQSITLPAGVKSIGFQAFGSCTALKSITLPEGITGIADYTFFGCTALQSIRIPSAVSSIGYSAFYNCTALQEVSVAWDTPLAIEANVFQGITLSGVTLKVPKGTKAKYQAAPVWKDFKINETTANQTVDGLRVFAAAGALRLTLPKAEAVHIYHVNGALVKTLALSPGDHVQPLPSGVYLVRVGEQVTKIVVK